MSRSSARDLLRNDETRRSAVIPRRTLFVLTARKVGEALGGSSRRNAKIQGGRDGRFVSTFETSLTSLRNEHEIVDVDVDAVKRRRGRPRELPADPDDLARVDIGPAHSAREVGPPKRDCLRACLGARDVERKGRVRAARVIVLAATAWNTGAGLGCIGVGAHGALPGGRRRVVESLLAGSNASLGRRRTPGLRRARSSVPAVCYGSPGLASSTSPKSWAFVIAFTFRASFGITVAAHRRRFAGVASERDTPHALARHERMQAAAR